MIGKRKYLPLFLLAILQGLGGCSTQSTDPDKLNQPEIRVSNRLDVRVDTLDLQLLTTGGPDSLQVLGLDPDDQIGGFYFEDIRFYFREPQDMFLVKNARIVIGSNRYYISNCFCDPELREGLLTEGTYILIFRDIDWLRKEIVYDIVPEH